MWSLWQKLLSRYGNSQTIVWAKFQQWLGLGLTSVLYVVYALDGLNQYMISPVVPEKYQPLLPLIFWALGKVTELARKRPGSEDPIQ